MDEERLDEIVAILDDLVERLDDLVLEVLREAVAEGASSRPALERRLSRARATLARARHILAP